MTAHVVNADIMEWARTYDGPKFHAILCDPPYHLTGVADVPNFGNNGFGNRSDGKRAARRGGFMGKQWDGGDIAFDPATWAALAEHLHPGGFVMAFASSRGWHRLACAIEDAGLRIHPSIFGWGFGSGFPKATRIDTQIDKAAGAEREVVGRRTQTMPQISPRENFGERYGDEGANNVITAPATPLAAAWEGHRYGGQALKPALEPIIVAQKPYAGRPVDSITATGAGALWVDGGRVATGDGPNGFRSGTYTNQDDGASYTIGRAGEPYTKPQHPAGRWPPNLVLCHAPGCQRVGTRRVRGSHPGTYRRDADIAGRGHVYDGAWEPMPPGHRTDDYNDADGLETVAAWDCAPECPVRRLGEQSGERAGAVSNGRAQNGAAFDVGSHAQRPGPSDTGTAARFFPNPDYSLDIAEAIAAADPVMYCAKASRRERNAGMPDGQRSSHPTVKPISLAIWLAKLLLPPAAYAPRRILIPFAGSGSEMIGAMLAGWEDVVGIEREAEYVAIAEARLAWWDANRDKAPEVRAGSDATYTHDAARLKTRPAVSNNGGVYANGRATATPPMLPGLATIEGGGK